MLTAAQSLLNGLRRGHLYALPVTSRPIPPITAANGPAPVLEPSSRGHRETTAASRIIGNAFALSLARPFTWLAAIGLTVLLPRYLGDSDLGKMNFAFAFADWTGLFSSFGIATYLTREIARRRSEAAGIVLNALLLRLVLGVVIGAAAVALATVLGFDTLTRNLIYLLTIHMLLMVFMGVLVGALQGVEKLRIVALIDAVSKLIQLALVALVLLQGYGAIAVAVVYVISDLFAIVCTLYAVWRHVGLRGPVVFRMWGTMLRGSLPFLVWETALLTYARIDIVILSFFVQDAVIGWYGVAYRLISIPLIVPVVLMTAIFPALSAAAGNPELFNSIARRSVQAAVLVTMPMALGLMLLARPIIDLFGYPEVFRNATVPTVLLAASLPLVGTNMILGSVLGAVDRQKQWALAGVGAAIFNPALNLFAIPYTQGEFGNGGIGAAAVTSLTEVFLLSAALWLLPRGVLSRSTLRSIAGCAASGAAMAGVVWLARDLSILVSIPLGALVYAAAVLLFRGVSIADLRVLRGFARRGTGAAAEPAGASR